jgi:hypothetical protein
MYKEEVQKKRSKIEWIWNGRKKGENVKAETGAERKLCLSECKVETDELSFATCTYLRGMRKKCRNL